MPRLPWSDLPAAVHMAVARYAGVTLAATDIGGGLNCSAAAHLRTAGVGDLFVKAATAGSDGARHQAHEAAVAPWLPSTAPVAVTLPNTAGWHVLATTWIQGRHANLTPNSHDLAAIADTLIATSRWRPPAQAPLPPLVDMWDGHATEGEAQLLSGDHLVHADLHAENLLVDSQRVWLIDWAMCSRGPAWVDTAETAVRLLENGHTAADALAWAARVPAWRDAPPAAVAAWVDVSCRHWEALMGAEDARPGIARLRRLSPTPVS